MLSFILNCWPSLARSGLCDLGSEARFAGQGDGKVEAIAAVIATEDERFRVKLASTISNRLAKSSGQFQQDAGGDAVEGSRLGDKRPAVRWPRSAADPPSL